MLPGSLLITSNPSPSPSTLHDDGVHAVLVEVAERMLVGDGLRPDHLQDSFKVIVVEGGQFVEDAFSHPPSF